MMVSIILNIMLMVTLFHLNCKVVTPLGKSIWDKIKLSWCKIKYAYNSQTASDKMQIKRIAWSQKWHFKIIIKQFQINFIDLLFTARAQFLFFSFLYNPRNGYPPSGTMLVRDFIISRNKILIKSAFVAVNLLALYQRCKQPTF